MFAKICDLIANVVMPEDIQEAMALGRLTALRKPQGGVRGIICGDIFRRTVARSLAQQFGKEIENACAPFQYALSTRAGTESVAHALQASTALDEQLTILSIDGISAFDSISRDSMLTALHGLPRASSALNFVKCFYGRPSHFLWTDDDNVTHSIYQAEGGEQGDPLMPMLYALGQHPALVDFNTRLQEGERLYAFLDDVNVTCRPERMPFCTNSWQHVYGGTREFESTLTKLRFGIVGLPATRLRTYGRCGERVSMERGLKPASGGTGLEDPRHTYRSPGVCPTLHDRSSTRSCTVSAQDSQHARFAIVVAASELLRSTSRHLLSACSRIVRFLQFR